MRIKADGWTAGITHTPSPNFAARAAGATIRLIVVHAISLAPREFGGENVSALFQNTLNADAHPYFSKIAALRVSAHFVIDRTGRIQQYVSCNDVAWHAGVSAWQGEASCNAFSIGIELEGCDEVPFTDAQYAAINQLTMGLCERYPSIEAIAGHSDVAPGRKTDPGPEFDWARVLSINDLRRRY